MGAQLAHPFSSHPEVREGFSEVPVLEVRAPSLEVLQLPGAPQSLEDLRVVRLAQFLELLLLLLVPRQPMCSGEGLHPVALVNQVCLDKLPPQLQVYLGPLPLLPPPLDQLQVGYLGRQQQVLRAQFSEAQALLPALHLSLASRPLHPPLSLDSQPAAPSGSVFGQPAASIASQPPSSASGGLFSATSVSSSGSSGLFGTPAQPTAGGLFGAPSSGGGGLFGKAEEPVKELDLSCFYSPLDQLSAEELEAYKADAS